MHRGEGRRRGEGESKSSSHRGWRWERGEGESKSSSHRGEGARRGDGESKSSSHRGWRWDRGEGHRGESWHRGERWYGQEHCDRTSAYERMPGRPARPPRALGFIPPTPKNPNMPTPKSMPAEEGPEAKKMRLDLHDEIVDLDPMPEASFDPMPEASFDHPFDEIDFLEAANPQDDEEDDGQPQEDEEDDENDGRPQEDEDDEGSWHEQGD
jgi:hypothetical protein